MKKIARMLHHMMIAEENWKWEDKDLTERKLSNLYRIDKEAIQPSGI